jgi:hypothetical protein
MYYGITLSTAGLVITPDSNSPSAEEIDSIWVMKSGYGYSLGWSPFRTAVMGRSFPSGTMHTSVQSGYAMFPEYRYSTVAEQYRTLRVSTGSFSFKPNTAASGGKIHFIPIWYPNGTQNYTVSVYAYDCWTPAGMIAARTTSNSITINGSIYDDHYVGRR